MWLEGLRRAVDSGSPGSRGGAMNAESGGKKDGQRRAKEGNVRELSEWMLVTTAASIGSTQNGKLGGGREVEGWVGLIRD